MQTFQVRWEGTAPLMMHNRQLANPLNHFAKEIKKITSKRKKTEEDYGEIAWLEFQGGLYWDEKGAFIPAENIHASIRDAGKISRQGENVKRGLSVLENKVRLEAEYPKDVKKMFDDGKGEWCDIRTVVVQGTCLRCRPIFNPPWALEFSVNFDERVFDGEQQVLGFMEVAGTLTGFCEGRPTYGRFTPRIIVSNTANGRRDRNRNATASTVA